MPTDGQNRGRFCLSAEAYPKKRGLYMRVKVRVFSGVVCEQYVYQASDRIKDAARAKIRPRFADEAARQKHKDEIARKKHARIVNANFSPTSLYSTLTFDDEHEVHTFAEAKKIRDRYARRLRYAYPDAVFILYIGRGKSTERIHMHMISEGIPAIDIAGKWGMGTVTRIKRLREHCYYDGVDHGRDYTGLANYLIAHWTPEQGGHRYKICGPYVKAEQEAPVEVKRTYTEEKAPAPPKGYMLVESRSTAYGYLYYKYVLIPPADKHGRSAPMQVDWDD